MKTQNIALSKLHINTGQIKDVPKNPRFIRNERYKALLKSIEDDPEMLNLRELVAYDNNGELVVILGNMRYRAMKELGFKEAPVKVLPRETEAKKLRAYIQKDNIAFGQNDWDLLGNEWDVVELEDFGLECSFLNGDTSFDNLPPIEEETNAPSLNKSSQIVVEVPHELKEQEDLIREEIKNIAENYGCKLK